MTNADHAAFTIPSRRSVPRCGTRPLTRLGLRSAAAFAAFAALAIAGTAYAQQLTADVRTLMSKARLDTAQVGVVIAESQSGAVLAAVNADEALIPASNMKALTSAAAIAILGPRFAFETTLSRDGARLIVTGSGDPALADPELLKEMGIGVEDVLAAWVDAVKRSEPGAEPPTELVIDDRVFDRQYAHPTWPADQLNRWYCAEVAGLNFHTNVLSIFARPSQPERLATIHVEPKADWIEVQNKAVTKAAGSNKIGAIRRPGGDNSFLFTGEVRFPAEEPVAVALHDPPLFFARLLSDRLKSAGITLRKVRLAEPTEQINPGRAIAVIRTPLETVLRRCNVNSYNLYAEALLKRMGHSLTGQPGTWENGAAALRMHLQERLGPQDASSVLIADGSGMSRENRVSTGVMSRWLIALADDGEVGRMFFDSLPLAGKDGTLKNRFRNRNLKLPVRAKTGYIRAVSSLSGYVGDPNAEGGAVVFSILVNEWTPGTSLSQVRDFQNGVVMLAHDWMLAQPSSRAQMGGN